MCNQEAGNPSLKEAASEFLIHFAMFYAVFVMVALAGFWIITEAL